MDYIYTYLDFLFYDPTFQNSFLSLLLQVGTLMFAWRALAQIKEMRKQNKYASDVNKIDALERFRSIIQRKSKFDILFTEIAKIEPPIIELNDYTIREMKEKHAISDRDNFKKWVEILKENSSLNVESTDIANDLELFAEILEDEEIFEKVKDMVAQSFCELVEKNPLTYLIHRNDGGRSAHLRYQKTIKFFKVFALMVGSVAYRRDLEKKNADIYKSLFEEN